MSGPTDPRADANPAKKPFTPEILDKTVIAIPLLNILQDSSQPPGTLHPIIIDINLQYRDGRPAARQRIREEVALAIEEKGTPGVRQGLNDAKSDLSEQYLFGSLEAAVIRALVALDTPKPADAPAETTAWRTAQRAIYRIWPDFQIKALINRSVSTVKADAARTSFSARGSDIVWAILDSGIDQQHPHFATHQNLELSAVLTHRDFTVLDGPGEPLRDDFGHGTHVAGIVAGEVREDSPLPIVAFARHRDEHGRITFDRQQLPGISGMAPRCKLLSLKVLDANGVGSVSNLIAAIAAIHQVNGNGRRIQVHGVNLSVGYDFEPEWFACGQSPLCVEVDRLVRTGVVVVVAAGNSGYGTVTSAERGVVAAGLGLTINDPGNAALAITVGSTHRDMPHMYGISYFSSKGPTGDGRLKPDLVAPGEKILSCGAGRLRASTLAQVSGAAGAKAAGAAAGDGPKGPACLYVEDSGTSMAAPHVSGAIAAFLSIRREFIGRPEDVKQIFLSTATDLGRDRYFQGHGLLDLMRAIQSI